MLPPQIRGRQPRPHRKDRGAQLVETALLTVLIALIAVPSMRSVGIEVHCIFGTADSNLAAASTPGLPIAVSAACSTGSSGGASPSTGGTSPSTGGTSSSTGSTSSSTTGS